MAATAIQGPVTLDHVPGTQGSNIDSRVNGLQDRMQMPSSSRIDAPKGKERPSGAIIFEIMQLFQKIIGQTQGEMRDLYNKIKERTDQAEDLMNLLQSINANDGKYDQSMDKLIESAGEIGVKIPTPADGNAWTKDEMRALKSNVEMVKSNLEKLTKMEGVDMQRLTQEETQFIQLISSLCKALDDTIKMLARNIG